MEKIEPFYIRPQLEIRLSKLKKLLSDVEIENRVLSRQNSGKLIVRKSHNSNQYFRVRKNGEKNGEYIPKKKEQLARNLAQKEYNQKISLEIKNEIIQLEKFLNKWNDSSMENVLEKMHEAKQQLVNPIFKPDEQFVKEWLSVVYTPKSFAEKTPVLLTAKGERVRSKSEVIIADTLTRMNIPYRYEFPLKVKVNWGNKIYIFPDFCCLNVRLRKEFFWEHFGIMDETDYSRNAAEKLQIYQENNFFPGENLIFTMESGKTPLSSKRVEQLVRKFLM